MVSQSGPSGALGGHDRYSGGQEQQRGKSSKRGTGGPWGHNLNLTLDILELQMKRKKKVLGVFYGSLETWHSNLQTFLLQ